MGQSQCRRHSCGADQAASTATDTLYLSVGRLSLAAHRCEGGSGYLQSLRSAISISIAGVKRPKGSSRKLIVLSPNGKSNAPSIWSLYFSYASCTVEGQYGSDVRPTKSDTPLAINNDVARPAFIPASQPVQRLLQHPNRSA